MKRKIDIAIAILVGLSIFTIVVLLLDRQPWKTNDDEFQIASSGAATYTLYWDKQVKLEYDSYPPEWELIIREEIRQNEQVVLSHLTETNIEGLVYGPGTPTPVATPSGEYVTVTGYDFDLSGLSGQVELWACLHWEATGETSLFVEFEGLTPDADNFYFVKYVNLPYILYFPIAVKEGE